MTPLGGTDRKYLRGLAHTLKPVVHVGRAGLTDTLVGSVDTALADHELIKVRFLEFKDSRRELAGELAERTGAEQVGLVGHVAIFYRPASDPEDRRVVLPGRAD